MRRANFSWPGWCFMFPLVLLRVSAVSGLVQVDVPTQLSDRAKELLEELDAELRKEKPKAPGRPAAAAK